MNPSVARDPRSLLHPPERASLDRPRERRAIMPGPLRASTSEGARARRAPGPLATRYLSLASVGAVAGVLSLFFAAATLFGTGAQPGQVSPSKTPPPATAPASVRSLALPRSPWSGEAVPQRASDHPVDPRPCRQPRAREMSAQRAPNSSGVIVYQAGGRRNPARSRPRPRDRDVHADVSSSTTRSRSSGP